MVKKEAQKDWSEFTSSKVVEKCKEDDAKLVMRLQKPKGKVDVVIHIMKLMTNLQLPI